MKRAGLVALLACAALPLASCSFLKSHVTMEGNVVNAAKKINDLRKDLTPENEYYVGRSVATNILAKNDYRYVGAGEIAQGGMDPLTQYVNDVGQVVVAAALETSHKGDRPAPLAGWHFIILESDTINATSAPGGFVFVTRAAIDLAQSEDELAAVLAHEVAHVVRGHALGTIKKSRWAGMSKELLDSSVQIDAQGVSKLTDLLDGGIDDMIDAMFVKGYSRDTEFEADKRGFEIVEHAGYDPGAMISYLERLGQHQDTGKGGFYDTHPKASDRISRLKKKLKKHRPAVPQVRIARFRAAIAPPAEQPDDETGDQSESL